jgi:hypothetical protein
MNDENQRKVTLGDILAIGCIVSIFTKSIGYLIRAVKMPTNKNK